MKESKKVNYDILGINDKRWIEFIEGSDEATFFHHPQWVGLLEISYGGSAFLIVAMGEDGKVIGGTPVIETRSLLGARKWISLPFTDHCRPLGPNNCAEDGILNYMQTRGKEEGISLVESRWDWRDITMHREDTEFVLSTIPLSCDISVNLKRIKKKDFRQIDLSERKGVQVVWGETEAQLREFYKLHCETRRNLGVPVQPWKFFCNLGTWLLMKRFGFLLLARCGQQYIAGAIFLYWKDSLIYKYSASIKKGKDLFAMDQILWKAISWGCENGKTYLDMGRTDRNNEGLRHFKRRWGAEEMSLSYTRFGNSSSRSMNGILAKSAKAVIKRSPRIVCRALGEVIYRYFA